MNIAVLQGEPVYEDLSVENLARQKCQKLAACFARANTPEQLAYVGKMQIELGCQ